MTDYYISQTTPIRYRIAKFLPDTDYPQETYEVFVDTNPKKDVCTCPSFKLPCKHAGMVRRWKSLPADRRIGSYYDDTTDKFMHTVFGDISTLEEYTK
jgi:hypothetical protein